MSVHPKVLLGSYYVQMNWYINKTEVFCQAINKFGECYTRVSKACQSIYPANMNQSIDLTNIINHCNIKFNQRVEPLKELLVKMYNFLILSQ